MLTDPWFYAVAIPAVILFGLGKGGLTGVGALGIPLMALAISPVQAAAITLPILLVQDIVGVAAFRRTIDKPTLTLMLPGAIGGIALGYLLAAWVTTAAVLLAVGATAMAFAAWQLRGRRAAGDAPGPLTWRAVAFGVVSGFTSQIAHAGGPPFQMYMSARRLPRDIFVGTGAVFFFAINWLKVPAYVALGQFTRDNLLTAAALIPIALVSTFAGVWLVRRIATPRFYSLINVLLFAIGAKLVWDGATRL